MLQLLLDLDIRLIVIDEIANFTVLKVQKYNSIYNIKFWLKICYSLKHHNQSNSIFTPSLQKLVGKLHISKGFWSFFVLSLSLLFKLELL